jgi:hypothetical protein
MRRALWFRKVAAVASSLSLVAAYVYVRSGGTLAGLLTQAVSPSAVRSGESVLPGSKSKPIFLPQGPPSERADVHNSGPSRTNPQPLDIEDIFREPLDIDDPFRDSETDSAPALSLDSATRAASSLTYPTSLPKPAPSTEEQRILMPGSKSVVISQSFVVAPRPNPTRLDNPLSAQPSKNPIVPPWFQTKP